MAGTAHKQNLTDERRLARRDSAALALDPGLEAVIDCVARQLAIEYVRLMEPAAAADRSAGKADVP